MIFLRINRNVLCLVFMLFSLVKPEAQCNPPEQLPTPLCEDAPLVCLLNACYETLNIAGNGPTGWCGGMTSIQNPQYFQIMPTAPDIEIHIHVDDCDGGTSLQSAILDACPWDVANVLSCDAGTGPGGTMVLAAMGLIPGQIYWLMIDGFAGSFCHYTITYTENIFNPGLDEELASAEATPSVVCLGYNGLTFNADPPIPLAHGYYWVLGWNGDTVTSTFPTYTLDVPTDIAPGIYSICVRAFSGCDTTDNDLCFDVEIYETPPEERAPESFCPEEFPFSWGSVNISGPGDYVQSLVTPEGCIFDSLWTVEEYPEVPLGNLEIVYCLPEGESSFYYEGDAYDQSGMYDLFYPGMGLNGCDSMAKLDLTLIGASALVEVSCQNGEFVLTAQVQDVVPFNADIDFAWYDGNVIVSDENPFITLQDGTYDLEITVITPNGQCTFFIETVTFTAGTLQPGPPDITNGDTLLCAQPGVFFHVDPPFGEDYEYTWSAPFDVVIFQDGSENVEMDFSNSSGGPVCVYATNSCGDGPSSCFEVTLIPAPVANFSSAPAACADSTTIITFTGSASASAQAIWDFDSPTNLAGSGFGPYSVSWAVPGDKTISLTVIEPGCDTATYTSTITVQTIQPPVINCTSTLSSVEFNWSPVVGSNCYMVSINGAAPVATCDTFYLVSPLNPGDNVQMILTAVSGGACPDIIDTSNCIAQNCPPPTIVLSGQDSACLNNPTIIDLDALVNGNAGTGTWAGPGIIDPALGLFDPKVATAGQHQVTFTEIVGGCPFTEPYTITVFDSITANFTLDPVICITDVATLNFTGNASAGATYAYDFTPATVVSGSGAGPYQLSWGSPGPKTVRLQINENGCFSDIISQNTNVVATLNAPVINCAPNTSGILFSWTVDPAALSHTVNTLTGQVGTPSGNSLNFTRLTPGDVVEIEIVTLSGGPCPDRRDTLQCIARACPMPVISITPEPDICLYPGTVPVDIEVIVTNGNGVGDWSGPGITDAVNGIFNPVIAGAGAHQLTYHYLDDGCDFLEPITINVFDHPQAFISNTDLIITCASGSLFLDGSGSSGGTITYQWTSVDGVILSGATSAMAEAGSPGKYQLKVTNTVSGCVDSTSVMVMQDASIPTADAGTDRTITCDSLQFVLGGTSTTGPNIIYIWSTPMGNIVGPTNGMNVTVDAVGEYNLIVRDTSNGCQSTDRALIAIDTAVATIQLTPGDTIDCNTTISTVESLLSEPVSNYDLQWMTMDGAISGSTTGQNISVSQGGTYTLTIEHKLNGCENDESAFVPESDEIIDAVDVSLMNIVCHGDANGALTINSVEGGTPPYTYQWSGNQPGNTMLTSLGPGQYTLTVSDGNGCSFTQTYVVTEPDLVTLDIGPNMTVRERDSVTLLINTNLTPDAIGTIDWGGYNGLFCPGCPVFEFIAQSSATISAMISDTAGCRASDSMRLTVVVPKIYFIPTVFSPNDDDKNDYFFISGRFNLVNIGYLKIFDRWGNQLFEGIDLMPGVEQDGWDGKFNGKPMQPGVYVYIAKLDFEDVSQTVKGEVTIIR